MTTSFDSALALGGTAYGTTFSPTTGDAAEQKVVEERTLKTTQLGAILKAESRVKDDELFRTSGAAQEGAPSNGDAQADAAKAASAAAVAAEASAPGFYPLQYFDDFTLETRAVDEWMVKVRAGAVDACSLWHTLHGEAVWEACEVLDCKAEDESFLIKWRSNGKTKWVSRLNVCFRPYESEDGMMKRRERALNHRMRAEAILRFDRRIDALTPHTLQSLAPEHFQSIVNRVGLKGAEDLVSVRQPLVTEVLSQYTRTMALAKHRRVFPDEDPAENTLDPIEQSGLADLPILMNKIPGHGAFSLVPLEAGFVEDEHVVANRARKQQFKKTVAALERTLCWHPPHLRKAMVQMYTHVLKLDNRPLFWDMGRTVPVESFIENHRRVAKDTVTYLMTTVMDHMSDALLTAYSEEEDLLPNDGFMGAQVRHPSPAPETVAPGARH